MRTSRKKRGQAMRLGWVQAVPAIWLIGPDGRVVARNLLGPAIRAAVAKALDRP